MTSYLDSIFERATKEWDTGKLRSAFKLFLAGAKAGDGRSQINLGTFYSEGIGVKPNRERALYWYMRSYKLDQFGAANNIAMLYRSEGNLRRATEWFERSLKLHDGDANVEIAKLYVVRKNPARAISYLKQALRARRSNITEAGREEATKLLKQVRKQFKLGL